LAASLTFFQRYVFGVINHLSKVQSLGGNYLSK
jgi:hypothetical protein